MEAFGQSMGLLTTGPVVSMNWTASKSSKVCLEKLHANIQENMLFLCHFKFEQFALACLTGKFEQFCSGCMFQVFVVVYVSGPKTHVLATGGASSNQGILQVCQFTCSTDLGFGFLPVSSLFL